MAPRSLSSEEFSFPILVSLDAHPSCLESPKLWKRSSSESFLREEHDHSDPQRRPDNDDEQSRWSDDDAEERMDLLWEDLNDGPTTSHSLKIGSDTKSSESDDSSAAAAGTSRCGIGASRKKTNVSEFMRMLKKLFLLRRSSQRSPAKTRPR